MLRYIPKMCWVKVFSNLSFCCFPILILLSQHTKSLILYFFICIWSMSPVFSRLHMVVSFGLWFSTHKLTFGPQLAEPQEWKRIEKGKQSETFLLSLEGKISPFCQDGEEASDIWRLLLLLYIQYFLAFRKPPFYLATEVEEGKCSSLERRGRNSREVLKHYP